MAQTSTVRGYASWIGVTLFFLGMGIISKAMLVELQGLDTGLVEAAAPVVVVLSAIVVAILGWRGSMGDYEAWEGVVVVFVPFLITLGYVPGFADFVGQVQGVMMVYNYATWILSSTVVWILSKGH